MSIQTVRNPFPPGYVYDYWICGQAHTPSFRSSDQKFPQPHIPLSACPICGSPADEKLRSSTGKPPGFVQLFTKCTNYNEGPPMMYDWATKRLVPLDPSIFDEPLPKKSASEQERSPDDAALRAFAASLPDDL